MKYFIFVQKSDASPSSWNFAQDVKTLSDVRTHLNDKDLYSEPSEWRFLVIKGRPLAVDFEAKVSIG